MIRDCPDDGTYWLIDGLPVMFDPPALTLERVRAHFPVATADVCRRMTGKKWLEIFHEDRLRHV